MVVYSPLEQFEPVSLLSSLIFGCVHISLTNVTLMFVFVLSFLFLFFNGYLIFFNIINSNLNMNVNKAPFGGLSIFYSVQSGVLNSSWSYKGVLNFFNLLFSKCAFFTINPFLLINDCKVTIKIYVIFYDLFDVFNICSIIIY